MAAHPAGVRDGSRWRFGDGLFTEMQGAGALAPADQRDPWDRSITVAAVARQLPRFQFDDYARRAVMEKLRRAYAAVTPRASTLGRERVAGRPAGKAPYVWTTADAQRLCHATRYVAGGIARCRDPYTLALAADLFAVTADPQSARVLGRLWPLGQREPRGVSFAPALATAFHGGGRAGRVETTALVAEALATARRDPGRAREALDYLIAAKDTFGSWHSTQATVLTLRALLAASGAEARGEVTIDVDGRRAGAVALGQGAGDVVQEIDLTRLAAPGAHRVQLRFSGTGEPLVQVVARAFRPRAAAAAPPPSDLRLAVEYDRTAVTTAETATARVRVAAAGAQPVPMPVVEIGVPPGFDVDEDALEALVRARRPGASPGSFIEKYERAPGRLVVYLSRLEPRNPLTFSFPLRARMPLRVQAPASVIYEYYRPESRAEAAPVLLTATAS